MKRLITAIFAVALLAMIVPEANAGVRLGLGLRGLRGLGARGLYGRGIGLGARGFRGGFGSFNQGFGGIGVPLTNADFLPQVGLGGGCGAVGVMPQVGFQQFSSFGTFGQPLFLDQGFIPGFGFGNAFIGNGFNGGFRRGFGARGLGRGLGGVGLRRGFRR